MASAKSPASFRSYLNCHLLQEVAWACSLAPLSSLTASIVHLMMDSGALGPASGAVSQALGQGSQNMTDALACLPMRASLSGLGRLLGPLGLWRVIWQQVQICSEQSGDTSPLPVSATSFTVLFLSER